MRPITPIAVAAAALVAALAAGAGAALAAPPDTTPPDTVIDGGPAASGVVTLAAPTFTFTSTEEGSTFACSVDSGPYTACASPYTLPRLTDEAHRFAVRATDPAGNTDPSPATRDFEVDATAPDVALIRTPKRTVVTEHRRATVEFRFLSSEAGSSFECGLDGVALTRCSSPYFANVGRGEHRFTVRVYDSAGNGDPTPAGFQFSVERAPKRDRHR